MTKKLFYLVLFSSIYINAQTTIVEEKFEKDNEPRDFMYLPISEKIIVMKGKALSMVVTPFPINAYSYDANGKKDIISENERFMDLVYSPTGKTFRFGDAKKFKLSGKFDFNYFFENKLIKTLPYAAFEKNDWSLEFEPSFNDFYEIYFSNQKGNNKIKLKKGDDIYVETYEIKTDIKKRFKLEKPNLSLLTGDSYIEFDGDLGFHPILNANGDLDIITKSLSTDSKTSILYKTTYDLKGNKLKNVAFKMDFQDHYFICSNNRGGAIDYTAGDANGNFQFAIFSSLNLNNYFEDTKTGDIYVYGVFSDVTPKHKTRKGETASGYYIFKFDKDGNKLWESIHAIDDKNYLQKIAENGKLVVSLIEYNQNLIFSISVNDFTEFTHTNVIEKVMGKVLKTGFMEYNNNTYMGGKDFFIRPTYESKDKFKNKSFSPICFAALLVNDKYLKYIKSLPSNGNHKYFETSFSNQGIWLIETDNQVYYKITLFKD
ncbi:MAG: hypothetical protein V4572_13460 [Bacteroidota bacterium]